MFELLNDLVEQNKKYIKNGHVATYIPALAKINPNQLGIAIIDLQNLAYYLKGNSVAGMHLLQDISQKFDLNIFE